MNRRDIIIITVLVNTGLLSLLVMMAINTEEEILLNQPESNQIVFEKLVAPIEDIEPLILAQNTQVATDEWDTVLKDYVSSSSSEVVLQDEELQEERPKEERKQVKVADKKALEVKKEEPKKITAVEKPAKNTVEVTVKRGDALEKIARANGTTVEKIRALNQLKNDRLVIGQVLLVPFDSEKVQVSQNKLETKPETSSKVLAVDEVEYYVIKSGDNPWKIAKQFHVKFDDLLKLNHLDEEKARNLKIGDRIRVK